MDSFAVLVPVCVVMHGFTISLLSVRAGQRLSETPQRKWRLVSARAIQLASLLTAVLTFALPFVIESSSTLLIVAIRIVSFFYGCKVLDLGLFRAGEPLIRLQQSCSREDTTRYAAKLQTVTDHLAYTWSLLSETRYHSFNTAVSQPQRPIPPTLTAAPKVPITLPESGAIAPLVLIPLATIFHPSPTTKAALVLLLINHALELLHSVLHPSCPHPLFHNPFLASSFADFWNTRWHACASPWLYSLAYRPCKKHMGRAGGVLAAFALSGLWHAWASAALVEDGRMQWTLALKVWGLFTMWGLGCLLERWIWGQKQGGIVQRVLVWAVSLAGAGWCFETLEKGTRWEWIRTAL